MTNFCFEVSHAKTILDNLVQNKDLNEREKEIIRENLRKPFEFFLDQRIKTEDDEFYKFKYNHNERIFTHVEALQGKSHFSGKNMIFYFLVVLFIKV